MSRKLPLLALNLPRCSHCLRHWRPKQGVVSTRAFCPKCAGRRRAAAATRFGSSPIPVGGLGGDYLLPPALRDG